MADDTTPGMPPPQERMRRRWCSRPVHMTSLKDLVGRIDQAAKDEKVAAVALTFDRMAVGLGQLEEIRSPGGSAEASEVIPNPKDFITMMMEQHAGQDQRPTDIGMGGASPLFTGLPDLQRLYQLLSKTEPQRAQALKQALQCVELLRRESVIMMMPHEFVIH